MAIAAGLCSVYAQSGIPSTPQYPHSVQTDEAFTLGIVLVWMFAIGPWQAMHCVLAIL